MSSIVAAMNSSGDKQIARKERRPRDTETIRDMAADPESDRVRREWTAVATRHGYSYNFSWLGVPIIQHPEDIVILQELLWQTRPDLVIETGIAHGGSLLLSASILKLLEGERDVLGVDIDIRAHARATLSTHPPLCHCSRSPDRHTAGSDALGPRTGGSGHCDICSARPPRQPQAHLRACKACPLERSERRRALR